MLSIHHVRNEKKTRPIYLCKDLWDCYQEQGLNRPFPSSSGPLYQNEVKCSAVDMEIIFILMQIKFIFTERWCTWPYFESEGFWNSEVAYWLIASLLTIPETIAGLILAQVSFPFLKGQINIHDQQ